MYIVDMLGMHGILGLFGRYEIEGLREKQLPVDWIGMGGGLDILDGCLEREGKLSYEL